MGGNAVLLWLAGNALWFCIYLATYKDAAAISLARCRRLRDERGWSAGAATALQCVCCLAWTIALPVLWGIGFYHGWHNLSAGGNP